MTRALPLVCILALACSALVLAYPDGAPNCDTVTPHHKDNTGQTTPSPYTVAASSSTVNAGASIVVTISAPAPTTFKGFIVKATSVDHPDTVVGSFAVQGNLYHTLDCGQQAKGAITHSDNSDKSSISATWVAPTTATGNVVFTATVVQEFATFWIGVQSSPVSVSGGSGPSSSAAPSIDVYSGCGETKSCFGISGSCLRSKSCAAFASFIKNGDMIDFELVAFGTEYVAIGFSDDARMGNDSVRECTKGENGLVKGFESYNIVPTSGNGNGNERVGPIDLTESSDVNGVLMCKFSLKPQFVTKDVPFDLIANDYHLLLALGSTGFNDSLTQHSNRDSSANSFNFTAIELGVAAGINLSIAIHGCLMVVSWVGTVSVAIFLARYYKLMWPETTHCKVKVWFAWHRFLNMVTVVLTSAAFILIFIHVSGWSTEWPANPHPLLGTITTALMWLQPIIALFRCDPGASKRPIFNWVHFLIGMSAVILGLITMFYTVTLQSVNLPQYFWWILIAHVAFFVIMFLVMEFFTCLSSKKPDKNAIHMQDFTGNGNGFNVMTGSSEAYQGVRFKQVMLILFVAGVIGFSAALIAVIVTS